MVSRRDLLRLSAAGLGAALVGCGEPGVSPPSLDRAPFSPTPAAHPPAAISPTALATAWSPAGTHQPTQTPTPTPQPPPPAGTSEEILLHGSEWQTSAVVTHSGLTGPVLVVLGGVHGNEPGGHLAATEVAGWQPARGSLLVIPRCNEVAIQRWERSGDDLGDLNRSYPGNPSGALPMQRMAAAVVALAATYRATVLLDLHESWGFYATREQQGTAFLGQTVTAGVGPMSPALTRAIVERVNAGITIERDLLVFRDGAAFRRQEGTPAPAPSPGATPAARRGGSSLALGGYIPGLTPILVEMGQEDQEIDRRVELHLAVVRAAMDELGMALPA